MNLRDSQWVKRRAFCHLGLEVTREVFGGKMGLVEMVFLFTRPRFSCCFYGMGNSTNNLVDNHIQCEKIRVQATRGIETLFPLFCFLE